MYEDGAMVKTSSAINVIGSAKKENGQTTLNQVRGDNSISGDPQETQKVSVTGAGTLRVVEEDAKDV